MSANILEKLFDNRTEIFSVVLIVQGLIQGPGEFAEGLAIGARSLFGHTVGEPVIPYTLSLPYK